VIHPTEPGFSPEPVVEHGTVTGLAVRGAGLGNRIGP